MTITNTSNIDNISTDVDRRNWILQRCNIGEKILDVGSTDGWVFNQTQFRPYITSIDLDKYDIPNFYQMDAHHLDFSDKSFDTIILGEILEHVKDPIQVLKEAKRVGKRILITVPDEKNWDEKYFPYETIEQGMKRRNLTLEEIVKVSNPNAKEFYTKDNYDHLFHNRHYTESTLKQDLKEAGIQDYKLERLQYEGWSFFTVDINCNVIISVIISSILPTTQIQTSTPSIQVQIPKGPIITCGNLTSKDRLRIAIISSPFFTVPPKGYSGLEQIVWDLAEGLDELGHLVTIFGPEGSLPPKHGSVVITGPSINTVNVDWFKEEEKAYQKWKDIICPERFDIVHGHNWFAFEYLHKMNNLKLRAIHTHHGGIQWETAPPFPKPNLVAISKWMKDYSENYFKQRGYNVDFQFVHNGIDIDKYPFQQIKTNRLLFVGRLSTFKQPHIAIEIARKTNHKLDIIGGTFVDSQDYVRQLEKSVDNDSNIDLYENASHDIKIDKLKNAKALLFPSRMAEPFGLVALEAMSCGTPVIALTDGAISEVVIHNKTGFICNTVEEMIDAINKIHTIKPEDCRSRAEQLSRKVMAENYLKLYQRMMNGQDW